jgi:type I restriction enzyme M protein
VLLIGDLLIAFGPNFFYTVTLPCTLWFLDKGKSDTDRKDKVLFIDARHTFKQVDRAFEAFRLQGRIPFPTLKHPR